LVLAVRAYNQHQLRILGRYWYETYFCHWTIYSNTSSVKEYSLADYRWGVADPTVVSLEILTVLGAGPLALYIAYLMVKGDEARHYWIVVISTAELYGG
jgi:hypothetical protein